MAVKRQLITKQYALYNGDCCEVLPQLPDSSIGLSVFSPPFAELYHYSDDPADMSNSGSYEQFFEHFAILAAELYRLLIPGRIVAIHCMDLPTFKRSGEEIGIKDFPGDIIRLFMKHGFIYHSRCCIWKDPLIAATRTKAIGLAHKQIVKDAAMCRMGIADTLIAFRKPSKENEGEPVANPHGLTTYFGSKPMPALAYSDDQGKNKRSHWIWQQYASPVWTDIRQTKVLPYAAARANDDEKHICPLQIDVIERCVALWSKKGDKVLTPFMGVGSEVFVAVRNGRKGVGVELKKSYYLQAVKNVEQAVKIKNNVVGELS